MKKYLNVLHAFSLIALMAITVSCSKDDVDKISQEDNSQGAPIRVYATHSNGSNQTRMEYEYGNDGIMTLTWTPKVGDAPGDKFNLYETNGDELRIGNEFECKELAGGSGIFEGAPVSSASTPYRAFYPASKASENWNSLFLDITGQKQKGNDNKEHLAGYNYMTTGEMAEVVEGTSFNFRHHTAVLRLEVTLPDGAGTPERLSLWTGGGDGFVIKEGVDGNNQTYAESISLDLEDITENPFTVYMAVLPSTINTSLECRVKTKSGSDTKYYSYKNEIAGDHSYLAGHIYSSSIPAGGGSFELLPASDPNDSDVAAGNGGRFKNGDGTKADTQSLYF